MTFTPNDKLKCLEREIAMRRSVYAQRVAIGKMKQADAERELQCMIAIAADYEPLCREDKLI